MTATLIKQQLRTAIRCQNLKANYWWIGLIKSVSTHVTKCSTYAQVIAEMVTTDFIAKLPKTRKGNDTIWVIVDRLTKSAHFLPIKETYSSDMLAQLYVDKIVALHGISVSIISDRDTRYTSHFWKSFQQIFGHAFELQYGLPSTDGRSE
ncbi:putative nucleotidyltransferase, Ribonuclease H [Helianthus annuus]|nr:putative nucleotidyltransferase, Ribonuclease H [Helianthus annuus]